ncbi:Apoptotic ATPase [Handroanthus impetiginosus]|uniref:Apoptotic ATPase n=1 Tax=Handroanthus impetiginosus TaxID=429701 RepID=A0A2G9GCK7_9LAMI|nr:Apoptotic ATPase [Handroanthus impetiginosus]
MADAAVEFLLGNLKDLVIRHHALISGVENEVDKLRGDLSLFQALLRGLTKKQIRESEYLQDLVRQILNVVYEAEDVIDAYVIEAANTKWKNYIRTFYPRDRLLKIARQAENVAAQVQRVYSLLNINAGNLGSTDGRSPQKREPQRVRKDNVVGFEDEAAKIIGYLREEREEPDVISIIGMPGLGKTTLAGKIFRDAYIQYEFHTRIWVYVSQEFTSKDVFLDILRQLITVTEDMRRLSDEEIAKLVSDHLETDKFLVVMDDVWADADWDKLKIAFPRGNKMGKVLITSRNEEVARYANRNRAPHMLRFLNPEESWLLFRLEVFSKPECPPELENLGRLITAQCDGLPLAIVVIGGILGKQISTPDKMNIAWERVSKSVSTYLTELDPEKRMEKIIALSYDKLPSHLRPCFLYFGMFPEDFEIPVWKLIRMWIAEGFIQQNPEISMEETAEIYLEDLIKRNLVRVEKMRSDGGVKTCRIHDMLRDFCKTEGGMERENFLQEMKTSSDGGFIPSVCSIKECRRLCIHSNVLDFLSVKPCGPRVRSFVCFSKDETDLPLDRNTAITAAFKLLRVLDFRPFKFSKIHSDLYQLLHLRYISLSLSIGVLPAHFSKLFNVQTLIVDTSYRTLDIKADISKMNQFRHLKTNVSATLPQTKSSNEGEKLRTLGLISPKSCTKEVLDRAPNLKKLGICGKLVSLLEGNSASFDCLQRLDKLEKLKLLNDVFPDPSTSKLHGLPPCYNFPPMLRSLTLSDTFLHWTHMSVLGSLQNLRVLKLKDRAFVGKYWETAASGFSHLEVLQIGRTDLVTWSASDNHFPRLRCLELKNCEELQDIPFGLAGIKSFHELTLHYTKYAAASAKKIHEAKKE